MGRSTGIMAGILICCLLAVSGSADVRAESVIPFTITAEADEQEIITVEVKVPESTTLEAFTIHVMYNKDACILYTGNDELLQGYGFDEDFGDQYRANGMLMSNAVPGQVSFTGVCSGETAACQGNIAIVTLLCYKEGAVGEAGISLKVTALHADGASVDVSSAENAVISCEVAENNTSDPTEMPEAEDGQSSAAEQLPYETAAPNADRADIPTAEAASPDSFAERSDSSVKEAEADVVSEYSDGLKEQIITNEKLAMQPGEGTPDAVQKEQEQKKRVSGQGEKPEHRVSFAVLAAVPAVALIAVFSGIKLKKRKGV